MQFRECRACLMHAMHGLQLCMLAVHDSRYSRVVHIKCHSTAF
jgi:hypothetical protein